jgi:membrane protein YqaA with SNARE-associated domain
LVFRSTVRLVSHERAGQDQVREKPQHPLISYVVNLTLEPGTSRSTGSYGIFRRLYVWTLALAARPRAVWALGVVSFSESSFFPIPPDVILIPMCLARPTRAWFYALVCTATSVAGGLLGYAIGALLYDPVGLWLITLFGGGQAQADVFRAAYQQHGHWVILIKGVTPIPYKLVTITSGFAGYDLFWFTVLSIITRGARFALVAGVLNLFGEPIRRLLDRHFALAMFLVVAGLVVGTVAFKYLF